MSIRRNTAYNLLGSVIPLAVSFVTIPLYLSLIGETRYGILAIAWLLLGYFGLFDLGLSRATAQRIAARRGGTSDEPAETFWTALLLNPGLGLLGAALIWPVASHLFATVFIVEEALRPEVRAAVPWLALALPIATLSAVLGGALQGRDRFFEMNLVSVVTTVVFQVVPLLTARFWGPSLAVLLPAALFARLLSLLLLFEACRRHVFAGTSVTFSRTEASHLMRFGGWVTVTSFVGPMMFVLDRFIIGATSGATDVTYYTVPFQLGGRTALIPSALGSALFARFPAADRDEQQRLAHKSLCALLVIMTPLVAAGVLFMEPFLSWWISAAFAREASVVGQITLLGFWVGSFARIPYALLQARGRPDVVAKCHVAEVLPYFGLLYLGLREFGLAGAAAAFSLRSLLDFLLLERIVGTARSSLRLLGVPGVLLVVALLAATQLTPGRFEWFAVIGAYALIMLIWGKHQLPDYMLAALRERFRR